MSSAKKFYVPINLNNVPAIDEFIGHDGDLDQLWRSLQPQNSNMRKVVILHGLGGIGKTQLAIRFARIHKYDFTAIFWLNGKDRETLIRSLVAIAPTLPEAQIPSVAIGNTEDSNELERRAEKVLRWLATEGNSRWLLIFDNVDQYPEIENDNAYDVSEFFPPADHGSIIITTRLPRLIELGISHPVPKLNTEEAVKLLIKSTGRTFKTDERSDFKDPGEFIIL